MDITNQKQIENALRESQKKYKTLVNILPHGIQLSDCNGKITFSNLAHHKILGYDDGELIGKYIWDPIAHQKDKIETKKYYNYLVKEQPKPEVFYSKDRKKDGSIIHTQVNWEYIRNEQGKLEGFISIITDITEQKKTQKELFKSEERLKLALDLVSDALWDWRLDTQEVYFSPKWYTMLGYDPYELPQSYETWKSLVHPEDIDEAEKIVEQCFIQDEQFETTFRMKTKDQKWRWIFARGKRVEKDENGKALRIIGIHEDITEKKQLEEFFQHAQKMESLGNLAGGIAHDFNNILYPIIGMAELLLEDLSPQSPEYENAEEILKAGKRASELIKQILVFSRQSDHKKAPTQIQHIIREVLKLIRPIIPSNIEIITDIDENCQCIMGHPGQIHQILMNLITNAYHAVQVNNGKIILQLKEVPWEKLGFVNEPPKEESYIELTVSDTGYGIDPSIQNKIFDPYFTTKQKGKGTGLGLAMVYGVVKEARGHIKFQSSPGHGSHFYLYFPVIKEQEKQAKRIEKEDARGTERILFVDDEEPIARFVKQALERLGYKVSIYTKSIEALQFFEKHPNDFDLVISDMTMPEMTGDQLATQILACRPDIPIIICTGFSEKMNAEKAKSIGFKNFLIKPIEKQEIAKLIRNVLDGDCV